MSTEDFVVACPFNGADFHKNAHLEKIHLVPDIKFAKTALDVDKENEMLLNQHIQHLMQFCDSYCENFLGTVELERSNKVGNSASVESSASIRKARFKSKVFAKYLNADKHSPAHEIEDSIIFISKSELQEKYLTPKKTSNDDHQILASETSPIKLESINSSSQNKNAKGESLMKYSSQASLGSHSSSRAFSKYFSMQNLQQNKIHGVEAVATGLGERCPDLVSLNSMKESSLCSSNNNVPLYQKSFVTEKLFNEFYHSTKQHSKSSSCLLNQLLYFKSKKASLKETNEHPKENRIKDKGTSALMHLTLPPPPKELAPDTIPEDLPYFHVHDALDDELKAEDVYAEIFGAVPL